MVPGPVPPELTGPSMVEQQMIARAHPVCNVVRKRSGQYAHEGHVVNISQDITMLATDLPWLPNSENCPSSSSNLLAVATGKARSSWSTSRG